MAFAACARHSTGPLHQWDWCGASIDSPVRMSAVPLLWTGSAVVLTAPVLRCAKCCVRLLRRLGLASCAGSSCVPRREAETAVTELVAIVGLAPNAADASGLPVGVLSRSAKCAVKLLRRRGLSDPGMLRVSAGECESAGDKPVDVLPFVLALATKC
jgi:hypothetical protein